MMAYKREGIASQGGYSERGVVLHTLKYSERKLIVHILTRSRGRMSYITNIGGGGKSSSRSKGAKRNLFQPLFIVDFQAIQSSGTIDSLWQCELSPTLHNTPFDILKSSLSLFIAELLYRIVREPVDDPNLYEYIEQSVLSLDSMDRGVSNFHIWFLVHLTYFLGYGLPKSYNSGEWLDLHSGEFTPTIPPHPQRVAPEYAQIIAQFIQAPASEISQIKLKGELRSLLLEALVDYYGYHCDNFSSVRSIEVLRELF